MTSHRISTYFICILFSLLDSAIHAQDPTYERILEGVDVSDFNAIQNAMNTYYANNPEAQGQNKWRRKEWFLEPRLYPEGKMENLVLKTFQAQEKYFKAKPQQRAPHGGWGFLGPSAWQQAPSPAANSGLGRINSIDFHPTNDQIIYAGTASGGLWKTTNGGTVWSNISPRIPLLSVADVEVDYINPNTIYLLTGDGDPGPIDVSTSHSQSGASSIGILKSTDGGTTWYPTGFSFMQPLGVEPYKLLMHPTNPQIQFVAAQQGIFKTTDGWTTFTQETTVICFDIEFNPGDPMIMYTSGTNIIGRSIDGGDTWSTVIDPDFAVYANSGRIELAVTPDFPTMVYAIGGNWQGYQATVQSLVNGISNSWVLKDSTSGVLFGGQAPYNMAMIVDPNDYRDVYAGCIGFARSFSQGATGSWTGHYAGHPDIHDLQMRNGVLYCAHDGGLWKSTDSGTSWTEISGGIACTEAYTVTGTSLNTNTYIIGAQDVGHLKRTSVSSTFTTIGCCDGMISIIHPTDINTIYISGQLGGINKSTTGLPPFDNIGNPGNGGAWNTPYIMDPVDPNILFVGKDSVHRTNAGGGTWQYLGSPFTGNLNCMAQGVNNRNRLYVSMASSISRTDSALVGSGTATWVGISSGLPSLFITGIAVNPDDANEVFITYSGYNSTHKVYKSTNSGNAGSWVNITGSLPNVPVNCIEYHDNGTGNDALYIGTDIGVFYRDNTLNDWIYFSNYLPSVSVSDLYINYANSTIAAGTWGRGLWLSALYDPCDPNIVLSASSLGGTLYFSASNQITSSAAHPFDISNETHYRAGNYIDLKDGFRAGGQSFFEGIIGPCPSPIEDPFMSPFVPSGKFVLNEMVQAFISNED